MLFHLKLDGVGPVDNRPSTDKLHQFVPPPKKNKITFDKWHVTRDIWHLTRDMQHVTCDMLWGVNILSKFQLPSSSGFWFMILVIEWLSNEVHCRTAPGTPGLLITKRLQMWLNNRQCRHKEGRKFSIFWRDNQQGKSSHIHFWVFMFWMIFSVFQKNQVLGYSLSTRKLCFPMD